ncbi:MAG: hypothetical protein QGI75_01825 [Phycisphaerales bacterium]|jgi:hypothetical protein|nr:hypothetical protein [Phycisphaerales bacterium]MDP6890499.1 hypothetical protein [Phycisphaerales bacterium]
MLELQHDDLVRMTDNPAGLSIGTIASMGVPPAVCLRTASPNSTACDCEALGMTMKTYRSGHAAQTPTCLESAR